MLGEDDFTVRLAMLLKQVLFSRRNECINLYPLIDVSFFGYYENLFSANGCSIDGDSAHGSGSNWNSIYFY